MLTNRLLLLIGGALLAVSSVALAQHTLIVVTYGADVKHTAGFKTLSMCEQAKSLALFGMTVEQRKEVDAADAARMERQESEWLKAHPPRQPTPAERKAFAGGVVSCGNVCLSIRSDGLMHETPGLVIDGWYAPAPRLTSVKHAECVKDS